MNGITATQGSMNVQMPAAPVRSRASEEAAESQAEKVRETRRGEEAQAKPGPQSANGVGSQINLLA